MKYCFRLFLSTSLIASALFAAGCGSSVSSMAKAIEHETGIPVILGEGAEESNCLKNQLTSFYSEYKELNADDRNWLKKSFKSQFGGIALNADKKIQTVWLESPTIIYAPNHEGRDLPEEYIYSYMAPHIPLGRMRMGDKAAGKDYLILTPAYREYWKQRRYFHTDKKQIFLQLKNATSPKFLNGLKQGDVWPLDFELHADFKGQECFQPLKLQKLLDLM